MPSIRKFREGYLEVYFCYLFKAMHILFSYKRIFMTFFWCVNVLLEKENAKTPNQIPVNNLEIHVQPVFYLVSTTSADALNSV